MKIPNKKIRDIIIKKNNDESIKIEENSIVHKWFYENDITYKISFDNVCKENGL